MAAPRAAITVSGVGGHRNQKSFFNSFKGCFLNSISPLHKTFETESDEELDTSNSFIR